MSNVIQRFHLLVITLAGWLVGNRLLEPLATESLTDGPIHCRERFGGMLNFYYREAD